MSGITIASNALDLTDGGEGEPFLIGEESRSFSGVLRNSVRGQKRNFSFTTVPVTEATWDTVRAAVASRAQVSVTGPIISNDTITASVRVSAKAIPGLSGYFVITGSGEEV